MLKHNQMRTYGLLRLLLITLVLAGYGLAQSQSFVPAPWKKSLNPVDTYDLNQVMLGQLFDQTLSRWSNRDTSTGVSVLLPLLHGKESKYHIWSSPQMAAELADSFPDIRTYFGQNPEDPRQTVHILQAGTEVKILYFDQAGMTARFEPVNAQLPLYHFVTPDKEEQAIDLMNACSAKMNEEDSRFDNLSGGQARRGETKFYRYRLALACTGEYGSYHGTTKAEVLAAMNELLLQVNAVFERELSIHFDLVANNEHLIFLDPETDPYDNSDIENLMERNKMVCNYAIGHSKFDLGHVLATKFGGQAQIGSVCNFSRKAQAFSGLEQPEGYYMGAIFAHELAHQIGAQHTQSNDCNRNPATAFEPGSGSTLMSYAGICTPDVQGLPDDYFHGNSLELIAEKAEKGFIFGCVPGSKTDNLPPNADAGPDLYVPIGTPFKLKGKGMDPDGDTLSYLWEQMDALVPLDTGKQYSPVFRSRPPSTSPIRTIGALPDSWEQLPQRPRTATFRLTVRDHHFGLGSTAYDEMTVFFIDSIGPLSILSPNTTTDRWDAGTQQFVEWDEAGTTQAPVHCDSVDIFLSTDGGQNYDLILAAKVPNTGLAAVTAPEMNGKDFRVKVSCSNGYLFDVSDTSFELFDSDSPASPDTLVVDSTEVIPMDTVPENPLDTMPDMPTDTILDNPADTLAEIPIDTVPENPLDTMPDMPMDTILDNPVDTLAETPIDTFPENPLDTMPDMPLDTMPEMPMDTIDDPPADTLDFPVITDTIPITPEDTIPEVPIDTLTNPLQDTIIQEPVDTLMQEPQDTSVNQDPSSGENIPEAETDCTSCLATISIGPNPTNGLVYMRIKFKKPASGHFYLLDGQGRVLQNRQLNLIAGYQEVAWDLRSYPSGLYWFHFWVDGNAWIKPIIVKR